ncbi:MAG: DUF2442 domain-containing protein [Bacteroidota bacterium]|nr:DUF2442 domain-containing protein [Bacteroidota bacterium]
MKLTREKELELIDKLIAETKGMIKPSGRFFDEVEISFLEGYMYFKLDENIYRIKLTPSGYLKKLFHATKKQRENYELDPSRYGVHWEDIDEDLSFKYLIKDAEKVSIVTSEAFQVSDKKK